MTNLVSFGKKTGWNILFLFSPDRNWTLKSEKKAEIIARQPRFYPNCTLAGFSEGGIMSLRVAAFHSTYNSYVIHSGLYRDFVTKVKNQKLTVVVGTNDPFRRTVADSDKIVNATMIRNNVTYMKFGRLGHKWASDYNGLLFN